MGAADGSLYGAGSVSPLAYRYSQNSSEEGFLSAFLLSFPVVPSTGQNPEHGSDAVQSVAPFWPLLPSHFFLGYTGTSATARDKCPT